MSLGRREWLTISGAVGVTAIAGCFLVSETLREGETGLQIPDDIKTLHIRSGEIHEIAAGGDESYGMIRWESGGTLAMDPDGAIGLGVIADA